MTLHAIIGTDDRQQVATAVCEHSLVRRSSQPVVVTPLKLRSLQHAGLYSRESKIMGDGQYVDVKDGKPFSTQFSFSRFLVPEIARNNNLKGWVLFCDNDFLWLDNVTNLFALADPQFAVQVVKHDWQGKDGTKMDNMRQEGYFRKLWSSLILWNMNHPSNVGLTPHEVNNASGAWLHGFGWLHDYEIGALPPQWNWIPGVSKDDGTKPSAVHFSLGMPYLDDHKDDPYAEEWNLEYSHMTTIRNPKPADWVEIM